MAMLMSATAAAVQLETNEPRKLYDVASYFWNKELFALQDDGDLSPGFLGSLIRVLASGNTLIAGTIRSCWFKGESGRGGLAARFVHARRNDAGDGLLAGRNQPGAGRHYGVVHGRGDRGEGSGRDRVWNRAIAGVGASALRRERERDLRSSFARRRGFHTEGNPGRRSDIDGD